MTPEERQALARATGEAAIREALLDLYRPEGVNIWLASPNPLLGGERPIDLIRDLRWHRVWTVIDMMRSGAAS